MSEPGGSIDNARFDAPRLFLSHASRDIALVEMVRVQLEAMGTSVYLAEHDPMPGVSLEEKVKREIGKCDVVVILLTLANPNSPYVHQEVGMAIEKGKTLVPIVEKGFDRNHLAMLEGKEYVTLDPENPAASMAAMTAGVRRILEDHAAAGTRATGMVVAPRKETPAFVQAALVALVAFVVIASISSDGGNA